MNTRSERIKMKNSEAQQSDTDYWSRYLFQIRTYTVKNKEKKTKLFNTVDTVKKKEKKTK